MTNMNKSIVIVVTIGALLSIFLIFAGCDALNHEANKIKELELRVADLEQNMASMQQYNKVLKEDNDRLLAENAELRGHLTSLNFKIEMERPKVFVVKFTNGQLYNKPASRDIAARVVNLIKHYGADKVRVTIKGYSSHNGPADLNMKLSKERAEGVMHKIYEAYNNGPLNIDTFAFGETSDDERKVVVEIEVFK